MNKKLICFFVDTKQNTMDELLIISLGILGSSILHIMDVYNNPYYYARQNDIDVYINFLSKVPVYTSIFLWFASKN